MVELIYGENSFALRCEKQKRINEFLSRHDTFGLHLLDTEDSTTADLKDALLQLPFLTSEKLVVIHSIFSSKSFIEVMNSTLKDIPQVNNILLIDSKPDKRTSLFKALQKDHHAREFTQLRTSQLIEWVVGYASKHDSEISSTDAAFLVARIGSDQDKLAREIEKLSVYPTITKELITTLTQESVETSVFELLENAFTGKKEDALRILDVLYAHNTDPHEIMGLIAWQVQVLSTVVVNPRATAQEIASRYKIHPFVVTKTQSFSRKIDKKLLNTILDLCIEADLRLKTSSAHGEDVIRILLLEITSIFLQ